MRTLSRDEIPHSNRQDFVNLRRLSTYIWSYRGRVLLALCCLILAKLATVGVPLVLKDIINALDRTPGQAVLVVPLGLVAAYGVLRLAGSLFNELRDSLFARVRFGAMHELSVRVLDHLHGLSLNYHLERRTGGISRDLERGRSSLSSIVNTMVFNIVPTFAEFLLVAIILLGNYRWHYMLVIIVTVIIYVTFTILFSGWRMQFRHDMNRMDSLANGRAVDSLLNYETVKYFNNEWMEVNAYRGHLRDWADAGVKSQTTMSLLNFGQAAIVAFGVTAIMALAASDVAADRITLGDIVLINAMMLQLFIPLNMLGYVYRTLQYSLADMDLVIKLLDRESDIRDIDNAAPLNVTESRIEFKNVNFAYLAERPILKDVSFVVEPGQKVAVVGPSGSGKSTLARLLFRFYDVDAGSISIDGQNIANVTQQSLRSALGIVPQDTVMFNESIRFNLRYANPAATDADLDDAVQAANLSEFIALLPEGFDTVVGERGLKLSGGEKQRMAIARVMLKKPPIVVFDEATSSLDSQSEKNILQGLNLAANSATSLVIAHRLSTIVDADVILVLNEGKITQRGTHQHLLTEGGLYADLWKMQQSERLTQS
ncbi:MAG: ABC transporter ATP-binding protein/permease [Granulosicoccus sp.]|nr:ABC transporter ATP-binding protein/permease [Granulosicoccus sp.]